MNFFKRLLALLGVQVLLVSVIVAVPPPQQTEALSGSQFQAGRIIDDSVFYNKNRMTRSGIQNFLNSKVPVCDTNGEQPYAGTTRAAYGTSEGYPPPYICLKNYTQTFSGIGSDEFCAGIAGGTKSAANIIYEVAQSCGINPQVLIVTLQKEQALVTDDWPWSIQYREAMGYGCPDSAPCDPAYAGFFKQMYYAARQFKKYAKYQNLYNYQAQRNNTILWHPNRGCGDSTVFIHNRATAGLYIYTPYRPNAAALNNLYGTGNACSSYGNRNFWRMFHDWFGNTLTTTPYAWSLESQHMFSNSGRTAPLTNPYGIAPGSKIYMRVRARNMGNKTWDSSFINIGTSRPNDRTSVFRDASWLNGARPVSMTESSVTPGGIGTFDFILQAPPSPGSHREYFNLVAEGRTWMNDIGLFYTIDVVQPTTPSNSKNIRLNSGQSLTAGQYLLSPDGHSTLSLQKDGNLVLYSDARPRWSTGTKGAGNRLVMQSDGNLVLLNKNGSPLWHSGTYNNSGARLDLQTDGNLVVYLGSAARWNSMTVNNPNHLNHVDANLETGFLLPGQQIETADRRFRLMLQSDGNLVLYSPFRATWASGTAGQPAERLIMQSDGNLVLVGNGRALWHSGTNGRGYSFLRIQADGNAVIYNKSGRPTWNTETNDKQ